MAGSLTRGCGNRDARSFAEWIENLGASLRCEAGDDHLQIVLKGVGSDRHVLLPQLLEMVEQPTASCDQIELERALNLQTLQRLEEDPFSRAQDRLRSLMFADGPYGHDPLGTPQSLQQLSSDDVIRQRPRLTSRQAVLGGECGVLIKPWPPACSNAWRALITPAPRRQRHGPKPRWAGARIPSTPSKPC